MKKSELRQIIKEEISKVLNENTIIGTLDKIDFKDSLIYYVNTDMGNIYVNTKVQDELGLDKLDSLVGTKGKWEYIVWDHTQDRPEGKYRIVKYLGKD